MIFKIPCSLSPKIRFVLLKYLLMFPCSLNINGHVPLFFKTPDEASNMSTLDQDERIYVGLPSVDLFISAFFVVLRVLIAPRR